MMSLKQKTKLAMAMIFVLALLSSGVRSQGISADKCYNEYLGAWTFCFQANGFSAEQDADCLACMDRVGGYFDAVYPRDHGDCDKAPGVSCQIFDECSDLCSGPNDECFGPFEATIICSTGFDTCGVGGCNNVKFAGPKDSARREKVLTTFGIMSVVTFTSVLVDALLA